MGWLTGRPSLVTVEGGWASARARRPDNQDRCACSSRWAVLSDGMGGYAGGAVAAELAVNAAVATLERAGGNARAAVMEAVARANREVRAGQQGQARLDHMGATLTMAMAADRDLWLVANVGDSPAWVVRAGTTELVTESHNLAAELFRQRAISAEDAAHHPGKHILTRAIGLDGGVVAAVRTVELLPGDRLVLASDGLAPALDTSTLHQVLGPPSSSLGAAAEAERLVELAVAGGATDNVTVVVLRRVASSAVAMTPRPRHRIASRRLAWR